MEEVKSLLASRTVWAAVIAIVGVVLNALGLETEALNGMDGEIVAVAGSIFAIYYRIKAVKKIK